MTGIGLPWERSWSSTSNPSMPGSPMSSTIRSKRPDSASSSPLGPSPATVGWWPSARSPLATNEAIRSSSSTIRIWAIGCPSSSGRRSGRLSSVDLPVGQDDLHVRAVGFGVGDAYVAAVGVGDRAHDAEPEAETVVAGTHVAAAEPLEHGLAVLGRDPVTRVADPQPHEAVLSGRADRHGGTGVGVLDRVVGELEQRLGDPLLVEHRAAAGDAVELPLAVAERGGLGQHRLGE